MNTVPGLIEFRIFDKHKGRVPGVSIVFARNWKEAKRLYREAAYPNRKALPSGIRYERVAAQAAELTDEERVRMEAWLCEHHVYEPDDDILF